VTRLSGTPDFSRAPSPKPYAGKSSRDERPGDTFREERPNNKFGKAPGGGYAAADNSGQQRQDTKPWSKKPGKPGFDGPRSDKPKFDGPKFDKPKYDKPKFEGGKSEGAKSERPKYEGKGGAGPKGKFSKKKPG
jgi:ATP-dependent RNA helicase DeaD